MKIKENDWVRWKKTSPEEMEILILVQKPVAAEFFDKKLRYHVFVFKEGNIEKHIFNEELPDSVWEYMPPCEE